ncbi:MAG TPA: hypothetical protein PKO22_07870 [Treponemataceae bacterium]|nr:hypothetical protein [Treponemataceae bacterium]
MKIAYLIPMALAIAAGATAFAEDSSDLFADFASLGAADGAGAGTTAAPADASFSLKLSGTHEFDFHQPAYWADGNDSYRGDLKAPAFRNDVGLEIWERGVKVVSRWQFDAAPTFADAQDPNGSWAACATIKPNENYVSWNPDKLKLSAGYQIFAWGVADRRNPTDNLNPRDYSTSATDPAKIPSLAADAIWYPTDSVSLEGVFIPSKGESRYREDFARALSARSIPGIAGYDLSTGTPILSPYSVPGVSYGLDPAKPKNYAAGAKLNYNSDRVDLSVSYLYDLDQFYTPEISTRAQPFDAYMSGVDKGIAAGSYWMIDGITLNRKRIHRFGCDAKTTVGKCGLWLEGAYDVTERSGDEDYSERRSKIEYTLGGDVNYGPNDRFYANVQYFGTWIPGFDRDFHSDYANGLPDAARVSDADYMREFYERSTVDRLGLATEGLMQGVSCNLKWEFADAAVTPQVTAAYTMPFLYDDADGTRYGALALNPELDLKPIDSFHVKFGADLCYAWRKTDGDVRLDADSDAIGSYTPENNVYLKVVYKWNSETKR